MTLITVFRPVLAAVLLTALALPVSPAFAQATAKPFEPTVGQAGKDVVWVPTPQLLVEKMLDLAKITPQDLHYDLGSGDGRTVITAAKRGARSFGIEYNPDMVELSRKNAVAAKVSADRATFVQADLFETDFSKANVVTLFLLPSINMKLRDKILAMAPGTRIVANTFTMEDWAADQTETVSGDCVSWCTALLWIVPANVAGTWQLGSSALTLIEVGSRTLPADDPDLLRARSNLANTLYSLGDLAGARAMQERVLESATRALPPDDPTLTATKSNLANTIYQLGDFASARVLYEEVLAAYVRTLPADHVELRHARGNLANVLASLGKLDEARALQEQVLEVAERTLPEDHPDLRRARGNLAVTLYQLGELARARSLEERVLGIAMRTLPDDHPEVQLARMHLANTLASLGELARARSLEQRVLAVDSRTLPPQHPDLVASQQNLASTLHSLGDVPGARRLFEQVLEVRSRTLPDDHPELQQARLNLASTMKALGDATRAREIEEQVVEVFARTLPEDHPELQSARQNLAVTLLDLGEPAAARPLLEQVLEVRSRTLPAEHPLLQRARENLAVALYALGDLPGAEKLYERVLEVETRTLPGDHPDLQSARLNLAWTLARRDGAGSSTRVRCAELVSATCRAETGSVREALLTGSAREAEERCTRITDGLDAALSFAAGVGVVEPITELDSYSFDLGETARGAGLASTLLMRSARGSQRFAELVDQLRARSRALAGLVRDGTTTAEFQRELASREAIEQELVAVSRASSTGSVSGLEFSAVALAQKLGPRDAVVAYRRYRRTNFEPRASGPVGVDGAVQSSAVPSSATPNAATPSGVPSETRVPSMCAFVVRRADEAHENSRAITLARIDLGPIAPIERAVHDWRAGLGVASESRGRTVGGAASNARDVAARARAIAALVFDPLRTALAGVEHVIVVPDDVLHLVPMDALGADDANDADMPVLLGDRMRIETRVTASELLDPPATVAPTDDLVVIGGIDYGAGSAPSAGSEAVSNAAVAPLDGAVALRGEAWSSGFTALPATRDEATAIASSFSRRADPGSVTRLEGGGATRTRFEELAPKARWLHIATHGWFASGSMQSWRDAEPLDERAVCATRASGAEQVRGMSPMLLCGLAFAGANSSEDQIGRVPGLITADELSTLDLSRCELAVLSACDTNVGVNRAGQGVASLQKALQMAGARSAITSLWKVPDEATKELMLDFYRRLWVEKKPKHQALWEAKTKLREARDERGEPKYTTRDWAAWVLTGDPD